MMICLPVAFLGVGAPELLLVLLVALLLLGPRELPKIARTLGKMMAHLRSASDDFKGQVMRLDDETPARSEARRSLKQPVNPNPETAIIARPLRDCGSLPDGQKKDSQNGHTA